MVKNSEFDNNKDGFDTNSQNNDDWPSPQNGHCAKKGKVSPITHTESCWAFIHNYVHDNNNPNVPAAGAAALGPVGTGMTITGGRFDTIMDNRIVHNGAWGVLFIPYPDNETPPPGQHCQGGSPTLFPGFSCTYDDWANQLFDNKFSKNGFFGNPTNSDFGEITLSNGNPINCYQGNQAPDGSSPPTLQQTNGKCGQTGHRRPEPGADPGGAVQHAAPGRRPLPADRQLSAPDQGGHAQAAQEAAAEHAEPVLERAAEHVVPRR